MRITAEKAREMSAKNSVDLDGIYQEITICASKGENQFCTSRPLTNKEEEQLGKDGYIVTSLSSIAAQKDGIYHRIAW